jgi:hypothetical protein
MKFSFHRAASLGGFGPLGGFDPLNLLVAQKNLDLVKRDVSD